MRQLGPFFEETREDEDIEIGTTFDSEYARGLGKGGHALMLVTEPSSNLEQIVDAAIKGGVNIIQLRDKAAEPDELLETANRLRQITAGRALLLVNSYDEVAEKVDAHGVQLPEKVQTLVRTQRAFGRNVFIYRSIHAVENAIDAEMENADYLVAGTIFASGSHPNELGAGLSFLKTVCDSVSIPVIAIGGVTPENAAHCIAAGAAGVAILSPIMHAHDPYAVALNYRSALKPIWPIPSPGESELAVLQIDLTVNGEERQIEDSMTIAQFLAEHNLHERMVVVEHNGEIVPRQKYGEVLLHTGDNLEIVQMMAGGS